MTSRALRAVARYLMRVADRLSPTPAIKIVNYKAPLASGWCDHKRRCEFNLSVGVIFHADDGSRCDGVVQNVYWP